MIQTGLPYTPELMKDISEQGAIVDMSSINFPEGVENSTRTVFIYLRNTGFKNIVLDLLKMHEIWLKTDPGQNLASYPVLKLRGCGELDGREIKDLGKLINGTQKLEHKGNATLFMANGLPVWDVALANSVYETAKTNQIGTWLSL